MENVMKLEQEFRDIIEQYNVESGKAFGPKGIKVSKARARKQLLLLQKKCKELRVAIQETK